MITITGPKTLTLPSALGGDDTTYALVVVCVTRGLIVRDAANDNVTISGIKDTTLLTISVAGLLASKGAEVYGYPVYFELDDVTALCPFSTDDGSDDWQQETWETWGTIGESHKPKEYGGKWYRTSNDGRNRGEPLPLSAWASMIASPPAGIALKTVEEFKAIEAANAPATV